MRTRGQANRGRGSDMAMFTFRVRHADADTPVELRVHEDGMSSAYGITAEQAAVLLVQLDRVVRQAVNP